MAIKYYFVTLFLFWVQLLNCKCNSLEQENDDHRIIGGFDAKNGQFPYQVSLRKGNRHFCGGSILNEYYILTAAHCLQNQEASSITVVTGTNELDSGGDSYQVENIISHPLYIAFTITNDIGLIKLKKAIDFNENVQPIKLPTKNTTSGTELTLSGWGTTTYPGKVPNKLQTINLLSISNLKCMMEHPTGGILPTNLCTLTKTGEGACHGDSGGPLVEEGAEQVGVVSWGVPCGKGKPDVFTRIYPYLNWIRSNMS